MGWEIIILFAWLYLGVRYFNKKAIRENRYHEVNPPMKTTLSTLGLLFIIAIVVGAVLMLFG
jgi:hypothetical protein|tara:strand:+ start:180 stop:365 length:186 start_codon:yes stop_codon:yes gene_type:complete